MLGEPRRPYTAEQVQALFPGLTRTECALVSHIEFEHRGWACWPHQDYPKVHKWLAQRALTPMTPLVADEIGMMPGKIEHWINQQFSPAPPRRMVASGDDEPSGTR